MMSPRTNVEIDAPKKIANINVSSICCVHVHIFSNILRERVLMNTLNWIHIYSRHLRQSFIISDRVYGVILPLYLPVALLLVFLFWNLLIHILYILIYGHH